MDWLDWWTAGILGLILLFVVAIWASLILDRRAKRGNWFENEITKKDHEGGKP